ncbi:MAG: diguanylate cyclase [Halopseudomonas sp.]|uniref:diguanylate cyclase domain-containing protein n=1 Tax=Halopseudomonas sp. TaxID=2901191 RepID=UPI003001EA37
MNLLLLAATVLTLVVATCWILRAQRQVARFRALLDMSPNGMLILDAKGRISWHNGAAAQLLDCPRTLLNGSAISRWLPMLQTLPEPLQRQETLALNPHEVQQQLDVTRLPDVAGGRPVLLIHPDPVGASSHESMERLKRSQYFAQIGTWDWDIGTERLYWSEAIYNMFGYQPGEVTPSYQLFCDSVHPEDRERVMAGELRCIETGQNHDEEYRVVWPDGSVHWLRETGNVINNAQGKPYKMMGVVRDITEDKRSTQALEQLAHKDPLTGLPNRLMLERHLQQAIVTARIQQTRVALVFIDLNNFKHLNDQHGHAAGDQLLIAVAERLRAVLRTSDTVARLGGDEFVVLLEGLSLQQRLSEEAHGICEKLFAELAAPVLLHERQYRIGASLGVAVFPDHALTRDKLIHAADLAMYAAKRSGNNQYRVASDLTTHAHAPTAEPSRAAGGQSE